MTDFHTYGTSTHTADELVRLVSDRFGWRFTERESDHLGVYHLADNHDGRIEIQPNLIPGDDGEDELYVLEHPEVRVLLTTATANPDPSLQVHLGAVEGLIHLTSSPVLGVAPGRAADRPRVDPEGLTGQVSQATPSLSRSRWEA